MLQKITTSACQRESYSKMMFSSKNNAKFIPQYHLKASYKFTGQAAICQTHDGRDNSEMCYIDHITQEVLHTGMHILFW